MALPDNRLYSFMIRNSLDVPVRLYHLTKEGPYRNLDQPPLYPNTVHHFGHAYLAYKNVYRALDPLMNVVADFQLRHNNEFIDLKFVNNRVKVLHLGPQFDSLIHNKYSF